MKKKRLVTSVALGLILATSSLNYTKAFAAAKKPYCTAASNNGGYWWTWTLSSQDSACSTALFKVLGFNQSVDKAWRGYYSSNSLNKGTLVCNQGKRQVLGTGSLVFENGINMANKLGWKGCLIQVK